MKTKICPSCHGEGKKYKRGNHSSIITSQYTCPTCFGEGEIPVEEEGVTKTEAQQPGSALYTADTVVSKKYRIIMYIFLLIDFILGYFGKELTTVFSQNIVIEIFFASCVLTIFFWTLGLGEAEKDTEVKKLKEQEELKQKAISRFNRLPL